MIRKTTNILSNENGAALVIALLMMIMLTLVGLGSIFTSTFEVKLSGNKRGTTNAFYAADSGVQVIMANLDNFSMPGKYVDNKYDPFTDPANPNPTRAEVVITHISDQHGLPRGLGFGSGPDSPDAAYYVIESTVQDQIDFSPVKSVCTVEQKMLRLIPKRPAGMY